MAEADENLEPEWLGKVREIVRLHDEAFAHYSEHEGCHKSSEGAIEIGYDAVFHRKSGELPSEPDQIGVYSYALGPNRMHYFDSVDAALAEVRRWHEQEMAYDPDKVEDFTEQTQAASSRPSSFTGSRSGGSVQ